ncbi:hypothetical protein GCM10009133_17450 [Cocleimonas flava]|uniref:Uncharacterized protein n=1 Tax=Cocleimonas flava TaxID=634765 RepID=A0A4R1F2S5_9GAMM|nr:hypothetical protein [Cocleimonas flava]TCJ84671.1 hypothetical protein EV695_2630 [Cocleimonas flava]
MNQKCDCYNSELEMLLMAESHLLAWTEPNLLNQLVDQGIEIDEPLEISIEVTEANKI